MREIKIAFFDVDGTLLPIGKTELSPALTRTLQQLKARGILLCIATGRSKFMAPHFSGVEFDAWLYFNGSLCLADGKIVRKSCIPENAVKQVTENARRIGRPVVLAAADRMGANGMDEDLQDYLAIAHQKAEIIPDFLQFQTEEIYQMMIGCYPQERELLMSQVKGAKLTSWWERAADIIPADGGKAAGMEKMLAYYQLNKEEAIAFGDGSNDREMLQAAGLGVAMGNASEDVKACADDICGSAEEDGVSRYFQALGLTGK